MPVQRRDGEGDRQVGPSWESLIDRQIREAMEEGAFEDLPYRGERLPIEDDSAGGEWAMAHRMLRNAGAAPPWIESDKEVRRLLAQRDALIVGPRRTSPAGRERERAALSGSSRRSIWRSPGSTPRHRPSASTAGSSISMSSWPASTTVSIRARRGVGSRCGPRAFDSGAGRPPSAGF